MSAPRYCRLIASVIPFSRCQFGMDSIPRNYTLDNPYVSSVLF